MEKETLEQLLERRDKILEEHAQYQKTLQGIHSYSYPIHQLAEIKRLISEL